MMKGAASILLVTVALGLTAGCTSMRKVLPERKERVEADEVRELKQRLAELLERTTITEVEVERLRKQVAELEAERQRAPEPGSVVSPPPPPVTRAPEREPSGLSQPVVIEEADLEVSDLEPPPSPVMDSSAEAVTETPDPVAQSETTASLTEAGQALYDRGYTLFHRGKYLDAESVFQQFLAGFGTTDLADNAQFWIGEARYARNDLAGAMAAFGEVANRYPDGNKVPDAMLKVADCQRGLGDLEGARRSYQAVIDRFPSTAAAAVAEERLEDVP